MGFSDLYSSGEHRRNLAHFASLASLAAIDGEVSSEEKNMLDRFAKKLDITPSQYDEVMKKENKYPIDPSHGAEERLERLYDLFRIIFSDHLIDDEEMALLKKYAIGLGFSVDQADAVIEKSVAIFSGKIAFEDYKYLLNN